MEIQEAARISVPSDAVERFGVLIRFLVEPFGVDKIPEVYRHVEMLQKSIEEHLEGRGDKLSLRHRIIEDRKRVIAIFKDGYKKLTKFDYTDPITDIETKQIGLLLRKIYQMNIKVEDFLRWLFDSFYVDNSKFLPPSLKFACCAMLWRSYLYDNKDKIQQEQKEGKEQTEAFGLVKRARKLMRERPEIAGKVKKVMQKYGERLQVSGDKGIILSDVEKEIWQIEQQGGK